MTPEWLHYLIGIITTFILGAVWYFCAERDYIMALWMGFFALVLLFLTITLMVRNDIIKRSQHTDSLPTHTENILQLVTADDLRKELEGEAGEKVNLAEAYFKSAANDYEEKRFLDAIKNCQKSIDILPSITAYLNLSAYFTYTTEYKKTEEAFVKGIQLAQKRGDKKSESALLSNRYAYYADRGQRDKAMHDLNRALELDPGNGSAHFNLAIHYCNEALYDKASKELEKGTELDRDIRELEGKNTRMYELRGEIKRRQGFYDDAILDFNKAIQANPIFYPAYNDRGMAYLQKDDPYLAISDFDKAIELEPKFGAAYSNRAAAYCRKIILDTTISADNRNSMLDKAISDCDIALKLNPRHTETYFIRGNIYAEKKLNDRAILDFNKSIEINPKNENTYLSRGRVYELKGMYDQALSDFGSAIQLNPNFAKAHFHRAKTLALKGLTDDALLDYDKAIDINPQYSDALINRSGLYIGKEELERALVDLNKGIKNNQKSTEAHNNRGIVYFKRELFDKAMLDFNKAIELKSDYADAFFNRGKVFEHIGQKVKALKDFKKACSLGLEDACREYDNMNKEPRGK